MQRVRLPISPDELRFVSDNLLQSEEDSNEFEEYFDYIMANSNFVIPNNWREAESLYLQFTVSRCYALTDLNAKFLK